MSKAPLLVGLAAGYVLGTRDGRERYEKIKSQAIRLWHDPRVQEKASQAAQKVRSKTGDKKGKTKKGKSKKSRKAKESDWSFRPSADQRVN